MRFKGRKENHVVTSHIDDFRKSSSGLVSIDETGGGLFVFYWTARGFSYPRKEANEPRIELQWGDWTSAEIVRWFLNRGKKPHVIRLATRYAIRMSGTSMLWNRNAIRKSETSLLWIHYWQPHPENQGHYFVDVDYANAEGM